TAFPGRTGGGTRCAVHLAPHGADDAPRLRASVAGLKRCLVRTAERPGHPCRRAARFTCNRVHSTVGCLTNTYRRCMFDISAVRRECTATRAICVVKKGKQRMHESNTSP